MEDPLTIEQKALIALESLGSTPDEIAIHLTQRRIQGSIGRVSYCPVAKFLNTTIDGSQWSVRLIFCSYWGAGALSGVQIPTPGPIKMFIERFDRGDFPGLIEAR